MAIKYEKKDRIAIFTIDRPEAMNAMNVDMINEFHDVMVNFRDDPDLWVGIITGAGDRAFCAGVDIKIFLPLTREKPWAIPTTPMRGMEIWKPLIAAINGAALGGGLEIALVCDIRIASENARLGMPEVTLGGMPGWGGTQRLSRLIPGAKASEMLLMGKLVDAQEAYQIGLVNKVVSLEELMPTASQWAEKMCGSGPLAVRAAKEAVIRGAGMDLEVGLELEKSLVEYLQATEDFDEGIRAFTEKRKPNYEAK